MSAFGGQTGFTRKSFLGVCDSNVRELRTVPVYVLTAYYSSASMILITR
jgi:hypothetical protein